MAGHAAKFPDRLLANTQQATPILPKNQRTITRDAQIQTTTKPMQDCNFGIFRGQRSTLGNGLSGEPGPATMVSNTLCNRSLGSNRSLAKCADGTVQVVLARSHNCPPKLRPDLYNKGDYVNITTLGQLPATMVSNGPKYRWGSAKK